MHLHADDEAKQPSTPARVTPKPGFDTAFDGTRLELLSGREQVTRQLERVKELIKHAFPSGHESCHNGPKWPVLPLPSSRDEERFTIEEEGATKKSLQQSRIIVARPRAI